MRFYGTRPAIEVRVNGMGPYLFLIDTGAGGVPARADTSLVKAIGTQLEGRTETSDAGGVSVAIDRVTLDRVQLGNWESHKVAALTRNYNGPDYLPHIDGILGIEFFKDVLVTLDFQREQVVIERGALPPADGRTILEYQLVNGNAMVPIVLAGKPQVAILDTGDVRALDIPAGWLKEMRLSSFPRPAGISASVSGTAPLREVKIAGSLTIGRHRIDNPDVTFSDEFEGANLGSALLQHFVLTIDHKNRRVRIRER